MFSIASDSSLKLVKAGRGDATTYTFKARFKDGTEVTQDVLLQIRCKSFFISLNHLVLMNIILRPGQPFPPHERREL